MARAPLIRPTDAPPRAHDTEPEPLPGGVEAPAALRAVEIGAEVLLKATKVDGVYDADPMTVPGARKYDRLEYTDLLRDQLKVLDGAAVSLCMENDLPIVVFDLNGTDNIARVAFGESVGTLIAGPAAAGTPA